MSAFPSQAEIVIVGGGIVGASVAYHLAKLGRRDINDQMARSLSICGMRLPGSRLLLDELLRRRVIRP